MDVKWQPTGITSLRPAAAMILIHVNGVHAQINTVKWYAHERAASGMRFKLNHRPVSVAGLVWALYFLRDLRGWRSMACLQIGLSVAMVVASLLLTELSTADVSAAIAALFTGADGFKRLSEINKARN